MHAIKDGQGQERCIESGRLVILGSKQHSETVLQHADILLQLASCVLKMKTIFVVLLNGRLSHNSKWLPFNQKRPQHPLLRSYKSDGLKSTITCRHIAAAGRPVAEDEQQLRSAVWRCWMITKL